MSELFPVESVKGDSPRLAWLKSHHVKTKNFPEQKIGDENEFGDELFPWYAFSAFAEDDVNDFIGGATEDDAIAEYARRKGLRLWNETNASPARGQRMNEN